MPYLRPTLSELKAQVAADIQSGVPGTDPLLRFSSLGVIGRALGGLAQLQYGYTDYIAKQSNPFTAEDEYLEAWAALKGVYREPATQAGAATPGQIQFTAAPGTVNTIPVGAAVSRSDGVGYTTTTEGVAANGVVTVSAVANADPTGLTGAFGNCAVGTSMTLGVSIAGINSTGKVSAAFTGGADIEKDDSLRSRMLFAFQNPAQGGSGSDYVGWARDVPGVTRAWCNPVGFGAGTVVVYSMYDQAESGNNGFPVGSDGVAAGERRGVAATGDQLTVANWIYQLQPVTALVYSCAPIADPIDFTISGAANFTAAQKTAIATAISGIFMLYGSPVGTGNQNGVVELSYIDSAIAAITGTQGFVITSPLQNIVGTTGQLPVLGNIQWLP
ncbi:baseplate J/gp47 family protein [Burkholderia vietnamiensis]|uniref:baseplate J/gp47 family protein n=1 Tax=Burkholderia TaxID=32008 RepID=UPI00265574D5|nr:MULTISPECIES: baseplate J/gp47 family protein [Burkholderia]MDN7429036.1 baseplate J/gp47 family protein [Burkholderia sp. AU45388]MDN7553163.1 baseplate J/gp47 family protein [Burkholderia vietnamiensis]HDR9093384.1 baseplate J/gp47 family protein [Burkholderia vietnamiensis]